MTELTKCPDCNGTGVAPCGDFLVDCDDKGQHPCPRCKGLKQVTVRTMRVMQSEPDRFLGRTELQRFGVGNLIRYRGNLYRVVEVSYRRRTEDEIYVALALNQHATPDYELVTIGA